MKEYKYCQSNQRYIYKTEILFQEVKTMFCIKYPETSSHQCRNQFQNIELKTCNLSLYNGLYLSPAFNQQIKKFQALLTRI